MTDVKLAILRTFEATMKALLGGESDVPLETSTSMGQICDHLQSIRHELSEVKARLAHIEQHHRTNIIIEGGNKGSLWQDDACAGVDEEDLESTNGDIHAAFVGAPIPLKQVEETARPVTPPVLPDIEPPAVATNDALPDIVDKKTPSDMDIEGESDAEDDSDNDDEGADAEGEENADTGDDDEEDGDAEKETENEEEEEGVALEEITFKGKTYYKDSENTVYILDENEDLSDPVGIWNEITKTVRFFTKK